MIPNGFAVPFHPHHLRRRGKPARRVGLLRAVPGSFRAIETAAVASRQSPQTAVAGQAAR
jgi:hypothetical protein